MDRGRVRGHGRVRARVRAHVRGLHLVCFHRGRPDPHHRALRRTWPEPRLRTAPCRAHREPIFTKQQRRRRPRLSRAATQHYIPPGAERLISASGPPGCRWTPAAAGSQDSHHTVSASASFGCVEIKWLADWMQFWLCQSALPPSTGIIRNVSSAAAHPPASSFKTVLVRRMTRIDHYLFISLRGEKNPQCLLRRVAAAASAVRSEQIPQKCGICD